MAFHVIENVLTYEQRPSCSKRRLQTRELYKVTILIQLTQCCRCLNLVGVEARRHACVLVIFVLGLVGCSHRALVLGDDGGAITDLPGFSADGAAQDLIGRDWVNPAAPNYIYLLDNNGVLLRLSPQTKKVLKVGQVYCPTYLYQAHSMSVDRFGVAWLNYYPGELVRVNTQTASCVLTGYKPEPGYDIFGMGFAPAGPKSSVERLFIASSTYSSSSTGKLAYLDQATLDLHVIGSFPKAEYTPELTGTRNGNLYGYFPGMSESFVSQLDQATAKAIKTWKLPGLGSKVGGWAFAHWGGMFYLFIAADASNSSVIQMNPTSGKSVVLISDMGHQVVGAGVSARAPGAANDLGI